MFAPTIISLLKTHLAELPALVCQRSLASDIDELVKLALPSAKTAVVFDARTGDALGTRVHRAVKAATRILLPGMPMPDAETVENVRVAAKGCDALVAVGSGSINDICKAAAFADGKPYVVFPTAASMNGYLSANASITENGFKKTIPARMPAAVFCDLSVIAKAPARLAKAGFGDTLARPTAQADWLMAHLLVSTPSNDVPFNLLQTVEPELFAAARGIGKGDETSLELLMKALLLSGFGMTIAKGSYPASQGEHMVAHAMDMAGAGSGTLHGEEVGVTTLSMAALQEKCLRAPPALAPRYFPDDPIQALFGEAITKEARTAYQAKLKLVDRAGLDEGTLKQRWEKVVERVTAVTLSAESIRRLLHNAEAVDSPEMLGWGLDHYNNVARHARFLRDRFTFLDLQS